MQPSLAEVAELVRTRQVSPVELTQDCLRRIEELNPALNAFITVIAEMALLQAREAEAEISRGTWRGPLHGIPLSLKDLIDTAGVRTTAGSELFQHRVPSQDAAVAQRLRQAGAVLLGKTNLHEFAYGGSSLVSYFGTVRNPWDQQRIAGGSSGGAAAAVAAGLGYAALGTDTAGSIRLPSALCGVVGFKPTYGLVSTRGVIPLSWSYDHVGPITRTVRDSALLLQAIAGYDAQDPASVPYPQQDYAAGLQPHASLRVGVPAAFFCEDLDPEIAPAFESALSVLDQLTAGHRNVEVPVDPDYTVHICEAFSFHAKFVAESPHLYQEETLRRIRGGEKVTTSEYIQKRRELERQRHRAGEVFRDVDVIATPAVPRLAPLIADLEKDPKELRVKEIVLLRNTRPFSILGAPAISVPCAFSRDGLPIGLQIAGRPGDDATVLALAAAYEQAAQVQPPRQQPSRFIV